MIPGADSAEEPRSAWERRPFRAEEMLRMIAAGIFAEDDRVELVRGEVLTVTPQGPDHGSLKDDLHGRLVLAYVGHDVHVLDQRPVVAGVHGLPEPDLAVVRGGARDYLARHPNGDELQLVIELAKTSQDRDHAKAEDYAAGGVPVYWLVDLRARVVEVYSDPDRELSRYRSVQILDKEQSLELSGLTARWSVASLLP